ncbi:hypothetical protein FUAX_39360 (plasmid) [Fulvitalea axinellae]|uniref:DUF4249 domain-containing protein n=1 Tax=Fulvitalea axinellae TaxID=1182444 RepID=A0AAU9CH36_9BACT|nr:hypothetical protein FUAX_39360 [Fulvitalea axinellae]
MRILFLLACIVLVSTSCTEVIDVDLNDGQERLVIEASIDWEKGTEGKTQSIKLSHSTPFYSQNGGRPAEGATVKITKTDDNKVFLFEDSGNGLYTTQVFEPAVGVEYALEIVYNGKTYIAKETMYGVSEIDSIEENKEGGFGGDEIEIEVFAKDPEDERNYYFCEFSLENGKKLSQDVRNDEFENGNRVRFDYEWEDDPAGELINVKLYGISKNYYNFMGILIEQSEGQDGPFPTVPVPLKGNCLNKDNPDEEVLGYFRLSQFVRGQHKLSE